MSESSKSGVNAIAPFSVDPSEKVAGLSDRPNQTGVYGASGLSAQELKKHFDLYSDKIAEKVNEIIEALSTGNGDYLSIGENFSLYDLVASFEDGSWAGKFQIGPPASSAKTNLLAFLNGLIASISALQENGSVKTEKIADLAVTTAKIADEAVTSEKLSSVVQEKIAGAFKKVSYDSKTGDLTFTDNNDEKIKVELPLERLVKEGYYDKDSQTIVLTLDNGDPLEISLSNIVGSIIDSVGTNNIQNKAVTTDKLADEAVTTEKIADSAVKSEKIADQAVTGKKIANYTVSSMNLKDNSIGYPKLESGTTRTDLKKSFSNASYDGHELKLTPNEGAITTIVLPLNELEKRVETLEGLTLIKVTDDTVAYEKVVPADVGTRAAINKVGCVSYKSRNICVADRRVDLTGENYYSLNLGTYEAGEYYLSLISNVLGVYEYALNSDYFYYSFIEDTTFKLPSESEVWLEIPSENYVMSNGVHLSGEIEGIMICPADEEDRSYEPFFEGHVKPTRIESWSRGSNNLCVNDGPETLVNEWSYTRELATLGPGKYYLRVYTNNLYNYYESAIRTSTDEVKGSFDINYGFEFELSTEAVVYLDLPSVEEVEGMPDGRINGEIVGIMICYASDEDNSYKPYAPVKLISTFEIPEAIRNRPDYGTDGCYIDFDRKVWVGAEGAETSIAQYLSSYKKYFYMDVQPGGTLKFINDGSNDVPSTVTYVKKL